jgi:hypothetical protein
LLALRAPNRKTTNQHRIAIIKILLSQVICLSVLADGVVASPPNVIVVVADDLGWTDLGCYSSDFYQTPHIDGLARDGMRW